MSADRENPATVLNENTGDFETFEERATRLKREDEARAARAKVEKEVAGAYVVAELSLEEQIIRDLRRLYGNRAPEGASYALFPGTVITASMVGVEILSPVLITFDRAEQPSDQEFVGRLLGHTENWRRNIGQLPDKYSPATGALVPPECECGAILINGKCPNPTCFIKIAAQEPQQATEEEEPEKGQPASDYREAVAAGEADASGKPISQDTPLPDDFPHRDALAVGGYNSVERVAGASVEDLMQVEGIGEIRASEARKAAIKLVKKG